jgi:hypothetical protein
VSRDIEVGLTDALEPCQLGSLRVVAASSVAPRLDLASIGWMSKSVTRDLIDRGTMIRSGANSIHELSTRGGLTAGDNYRAEASSSTSLISINRFYQ